MRWKHRLCRFGQDDGVGMVEYALILSLICLAVVIALTSLGDSIKQVLERTSTALSVQGGATQGDGDEVADPGQGGGGETPGEGDDGRESPPVLIGPPVVEPIEPGPPRPIKGPPIIELPPIRIEPPRPPRPPVYER